MFLIFLRAFKNAIVILTWLAGRVLVRVLSLSLPRPPGYGLAVAAGSRLTQAWQQFRTLAGSKLSTMIYFYNSILNSSFIEFGWMFVT